MVRALSAAEIQSIARLPSRDVLNAQLVGTIAAPLTGLVRTLNALIAGLAIQLQAIADQGLVEWRGAGRAGAPSEPEARGRRPEPEAAGARARGRAAAAEETARAEAGRRGARG